MPDVNEDILELNKDKVRDNSDKAQVGNGYEEDKFQFVEDPKNLRNLSGVLLPKIREKLIRRERARSDAIVKEKLQATKLAHRESTNTYSDSNT